MHRAVCYYRMGQIPGEMVKYLFVVCLSTLLLGSNASAQSVAVTHCQGQCPEYGSPVAARQSNIVIHHVYAAGVNGKTTLPDWVAYRLTPEAVGVASLLPRQWQADRLVKYSPLEDIIQAGEEELKVSATITRNSNPYAGSSAELVEPEDRARLAPITSFANTPYWSDLNNFSNMVPMPATLRLGPWLRLEQSLNRMVSAGDELYVIAGPLYLINMLSLSPSSEDLNPSAYYKLVADDSGVAAFLYPNDAKQTADFCEFTTSVSEIQEMTDLEFFPDRKRLAESSSLLAKLGCR